MALLRLAGYELDEAANKRPVEEKLLIFPGLRGPDAHSPAARPVYAELRKEE